MSNLVKDYFDVCVKILECRGLSTQMKNISSQVCVQVGNEKRNSKVILHTTKPFFDDYFVFTKYMILSEFMDTLITISAMHRRKHLKVRKLIGCIKMDIATVWNQPDRQLNKWFLLSLPSDHSLQGRAFVECHIKILTPNKYQHHYNLSSFKTSEIIGSKKARYKVLVYHGTGLCEQTMDKDKRVSVKVLYAGKSKSTNLRKLDELVIWNEQISFIELFPPMRQRMTLMLKQGKKTMAVRNFNIIDFFEIFHSGFLDMFGPTFIHLYTEKEIYQGSLLIGLESEILGQLKEFEHAHGIVLNPIRPIAEAKYGFSKNFLCFGIVFELVITNEKISNDDIFLSFEMGSVKKETQKYSAFQYDKFSWIPFDKNKPCIELKNAWPDCTFRHYNTNVLGSLAVDLQNALKNSNQMTARGCIEEAKKSLLSACRTFKKHHRKAIHLLMEGVTELDKKHTMFLKEQILSLATALATDLSLSDVKERCEFFLSVYKSRSDDQQGCLPLLRITLYQNKTVIGYCVVQPKEILFSEVKQRKGANSGKINYLYFKGPREEVVAKADIWLWLGDEKHLGKCEELFPPGYLPYNKTDEKPLPLSLTYPITHLYTAICHIHSALLNGEAASEGDCDPMIKVVFHNQSRKTLPAKRTIAPNWKETLIIKDIKMYRSPQYLMANPPPLTLQLWNEATEPSKFLGFGLLNANVSLKPVSDITELPLKWCEVGKKCEVLLACAIYPVAQGVGVEESFRSMRKPNNIIPRLHERQAVSHRLEIVFWGIRPLYPRALKHIVQPQIFIQLDTARITSDVIPKVSTTFNFTHDSQIAKLKLPQDRLISPPMIIKITSNLKYLVTLTEKNIYRYEHHLPKKSQWEIQNGRRHQPSEKTAASNSLHQVTFPDLVPHTEVKEKRPSSIEAIKEIPGRIKNLVSDFSSLTKLYPGSIEDHMSSEDSNNEDLVQDWWDRYWSNQIKNYEDTLEDQPEFTGFTDVLSNFQIKKRKKGDENDYFEIGTLKAIISLYKWPVDEPVVTIQGQDPEMGILKLTELSSRVNLLLRVYCVKAIDLYPSDLSGKSDPFIEIATPSKIVSDKYNKIIAQLNPVFGTCLEINATLPTDSLLAIRIMDWDAFSTNDVIGETIIDIENRFYSQHRAMCGLPESYETTGPNAWRDIETPKEILERLCNTHNLPLPQYYEKSVNIGSHKFFIPKSSPDKAENQQRLALAALNHWNEMPIVGRPLVSEHTETRLLFKEDRVGLVRGRLVMWLDMFDLSLGNVPLARDITPRTPQSFELRVNIFNTSKIPLIDEFAFGTERCTDIVVTGYLGDSRNMQKTDVHYKSYTGEGNFNWRFVFPFLYYRKEKQMVFYRKNLFDIGKIEHKVPPILHLYVYDSEGLMEDNIIGVMKLNLCAMPVGAPSVRKCSMEKFINKSNFVDLFKVYHLQGWWPFMVNNTSMAGTIPKDRGFLEAEFFLITGEEARKSPAGLGRSPPDPLPVPARAHSRKNPCQVIEELLSRNSCQAYCGITLNFVIVLLLFVLLGILIYTLPSMYEKLKPWLLDTL